MRGASFQQEPFSCSSRISANRKKYCDRLHDINFHFLKTARKHHTKKLRRIIARNQAKARAHFWGFRTLTGKLHFPHIDDFPTSNDANSRNRSTSRPPDRTITKEDIPKIAANNTVFAQVTRWRPQQNPGVFEKNTADSHSRCAFDISHYPQRKPLTGEKLR